MKKFFKILGITLGALIVLVAKDGAFLLNDKELDLDTQKSVEIVVYEDGRLETRRP